MTRIDFEQFAAILKRDRAAFDAEGQDFILFCKITACVLVQINPNFNQDKFLSACGLTLKELVP